LREADGGGADRPVVIVPYDDRWPEIFSAERKRLKGIMGESVQELHHIGSTSVPGLSGKPVIDCLGIAPDLRRVDALNPRLRTHGLDARGEYGIEGRRYFAGYAASGHRLHLHVFRAGHALIGRHLRFRDYLRAHEAEARRYEEEKLRLADGFALDRAGYQEGKAKVIEELCDRAARWKSVREGN